MPRTYRERAAHLLDRINDRLDGLAWTAHSLMETYRPFMPQTQREQELLDTYDRLAETLAADDGP